MQVLQKSQIREIIEQTDLYELIAPHIKLRRVGTSWEGRCPFHADKGPSFHIYPDSRKFTCFGCGQKGDAIDWLIETQGMSWIEAVKQLADAAKISIDLEHAQLSEQHDTLYRLNQIAQEFYHGILVNNGYDTVSASGKYGRIYVVGRGLDRTIADAFGVGYAPDNRTLLSDYLQSLGYSQEDIVSAGLLTRTSDGRIYDRFWGRIVFPIKDRQGRVVGFGGRARTPEQKPKYLNTAATPLFDKSALVYGLDQARMTIRREKTVVLVEGYLDVLTAHQHGFTNVVATMGTSLTVKQAEYLKGLSERMILAYDADGAGQMAAIRSIEKLRGKGELYIAVVPDGKDPDDFIRNGGDWQGLLSKPIPFVSYVIRDAAERVGEGDIRAKSKVIREIGVLVRELQDSVEQEQYIREIARAFDTTEAAVRSSVLNGQAPVMLKSTQEVDEIPMNPLLGGQPEVRDYLLMLIQEVSDAEEAGDEGRVVTALKALQDFYTERNHPHEDEPAVAD